MAKAIPAALLPEKLAVVVLPADCANGTLMLSGAGLSCYGRAPGYLLLRMWPAAGKLNRLGPVLARSFIHGIRRKAQKADGPIPLGEAFVMEGLAAAFVFPRRTDRLPAISSLRQAAGRHSEKSFSVSTATPKRRISIASASTLTRCSTREPRPPERLADLTNLGFAIELNALPVLLGGLALLMAGRLFKHVTA